MSTANYEQDKILRKGVIHIMNQARTAPRARRIGVLLVCAVLLSSFTGCEKGPNLNQESLGIIKHRDQRWFYELTRNSSPSEEFYPDWGKGVRVAVIDTGFDLTHPDLSRADITLKEIGQNPVELPRALDHGAAILGILCAYPHDETGVLGLTPSATVLAVSLGLESTGSGEASVAAGAVKEAIEAAVAWKADIISMSFRLHTDDPELKAAVDRAFGAGCVLIAADGGGGGGVYYPAAYENVIWVGTLLDGANVLGCYNCVLLPADYVVSISASAMPEAYGSFTGSSMAAPMMAGMVAIELQNFPERTNEQILEVCKTLYDKPGTTLDGFINLCSQYP